MKLGKLLCFVGLHRWSKARTIYGYANGALRVRYDCERECGAAKDRP